MTTAVAAPSVDLVGGVPLTTPPGGRATMPAGGSIINTTDQPATVTIRGGQVGIAAPAGVQIRATGTSVSCVAPPSAENGVVCTIEQPESMVEVSSIEALPIVMLPRIATPAVVVVGLAGPGASPAGAAQTRSAVAATGQPAAQALPRAGAAGPPDRPVSGGYLMLTGLIVVSFALVSGLLLRRLRSPVTATVPRAATPDQRTGGGPG